MVRALAFRYDPLRSGEEDKVYIFDLDHPGQVPSIQFEFMPP